MGEKFAIAFDVAVVVLLVVFSFVGAKKGFAKVVLGLVSTVAAFALAMGLSSPIADAVYKKWVEKPIESQLDETTNKMFSELVLGSIADIDFDKVKINSENVNDIAIDYAGTQKAIVDLSKLDLRSTGVTKADFEKIGISDDTSLGLLNAKTADFSKEDIEKYGLGKLAVAQYIAVNWVQRPEMANLNVIINQVGKFLPNLSGSTMTDGVSVSAVRAVTLKMFDTQNSFKSAVMNGIIEPNLTMFIRTIAFGIIFFLVSLVLRIVASVSSLINKIPVIGKVNAFLGFIMGLLEGIIVVFIVCLVTRLIVSLCGTNSILFNETAINSTYVFKIFYNFDFLNFLT